MVWKGDSNLPTAIHIPPFLKSQLSIGRRGHQHCYESRPQPLGSPSPLEFFSLARLSKSLLVCDTPLINQLEWVAVGKFMNFLLRQFRNVYFLVWRVVCKLER